KNFLAESALFQDYESSEKKYAVIKDETEIKNQYQALQKEVTLLKNSEGEIVRVLAAINTKKDRILDLREELEHEELALANLEKRRDEFTKYVETNSG